MVKSQVHHDSRGSGDGNPSRVPVKGFFMVDEFFAAQPRDCWWRDSEQARARNHPRAYQPDVGRPFADRYRDFRS